MASAWCSGQIYARTADVGTAQVFAFAQPAIMGYGMGNGIELHVQDRTGGSVERLNGHAKRLIGVLNARPEVQMAYSMFDTKYPQYVVEVDAVQCLRAGITPSDVLGVLSGYVGGSYVSNVNRFSKIYRVMVQADKEHRFDTDALGNMFVRTSGGEMAPVGQFITLTKVYGAETLDRFNMYPSIAVSVMPAEGYSTGDVIAAIGEAAAQTLPTGYGYELGGISREEAESDQYGADIHALRGLYLPYPLRPLREPVHPAGRHLLRAVRSCGSVPLRPAVRCGEQYLHAGGAYHAHRTALQDRHSADRVCLGAPAQGHGNRPGSAVRRYGASATHPDDRPDDDHRPAAAALRLGSPEPTETSR